MSTFTWTDEQELIFSTIADALQPGQPDQVIAINAVAGSSKSSSLVEATKQAVQLNPNLKVRYLVFGALASAEAKADFGTNAIVSTLHSLAYFYEVTHSNPKRYLPSKRPYISWQDIPKYIKRPFGIDFESIQLVDAYCNSYHTDFPSYVREIDSLAELPTTVSVVKLASDLMDLMYLGKMPCTHAFYLKVFYINLLNNNITLPQTDMLLIDEVQDVSPITVEIIKKFPAKVKVLVGDEHQAIFSWMGTINAFNTYPEATRLSLSNTFRVNKPDARKIEKFMQKFVDPDIVFNGTDHMSPLPKNPTQAYITRTNGALIGKMIELGKANIPYHLATKGKIEQMFKLPLSIAYTKPGPDLRISDPAYDIQHAVNEWAANPVLHKQFPTKYSYLMNVNKNNPEVFNAVKLLVTHGYEVLKTTEAYAKSAAKSTAKLSLMTAHTAKGITRDIVEIADDLNESIEELITKVTQANHKPNNEELEALYVYYVAVTRHKYTLTNAKFIV